MEKRMDMVEITNIFSSMNLPLIEKGITEVQNAKDNFKQSKNFSKSEDFVNVITVSNGTGNLNKKVKNNAKLERRII